MNETLKAKIERVAEKSVDLLESFIEETKKSGEYDAYSISFEAEALRQIIEVMCKLDAYNSEAYTLGSSGLICKPEKTPYKV